MSPCAGTSTAKTCFSKAMGHVISDLAVENDKICAVTAAMCDGTGLCEFKERFPKRFFDVGIAEEHALTFAAGLAANGMRPFVAIYSTFLQRGFDNIIHDIALQKLPVIMCVDRAGLNAGDGATHHGMFDVAFLSEIPNLRIYTPATIEVLELCIKDALERNMPCAIRYPNGTEKDDIVSAFYSGERKLPLGAVCNFEKHTPLDAVIVTHGRIAQNALVAQKMLGERGVAVGIVLLEVLKPYNVTLDNILSLIPDGTRSIVFLEEEIRSGGMGVCLCDELSKRGEVNINTKIMAVDDIFVTDRKVGEDIYTSAGIDADSICAAINKI